MNPTILPSIAVLAGIILIFLVGREVVCWYWKVNKSVELLDEQNQMIANIMHHFKIKREG